MQDSSFKPAVEPGDRRVTPSRAVEEIPFCGIISPITVEGPGTVAALAIASLLFGTTPTANSNATS